MLKAVSAPFKKGVNFTIWLEHRDAEHIQADFFDKSDFENVKSLGCDVVRVPIHFERFCNKENGYVIPDKILGIMDNIAEWSRELQMYVIFDFHNATDVDSRTSDEVEGILMPIWTQIAARYKDASPYVIYELMNEPHGIEIDLWNEVIERVFYKVQSIDPNHYIIVGGADWNSFAAMTTLPKFKSDKVIYNFHFYDPHTFTHQGASWCHMERVVGIPFPFDPSRMPELPEDATEYEKAKFENYPKDGTLEAVTGFFDRYAEFSIERNAPVYCGEFGCFSPFANHEERVNWYRIVAGLLEERNIARTSWDYYGSFGMFDFKKVDFTLIREKGIKVLKFPKDLDFEIVEALGLNVPEINA